MIRYIIFWIFFLGFVCTKMAGDKRRAYRWGWGTGKFNEIDQ
jgi:hypothetical protein